MQPAGLALAILATSACAPTEARVGDVPAGTRLRALDEQGNPVELRVDAITPDPDDRELQLYSVSVLVEGRWADYCKPDLSGGMKAVALSGSWDARGAYHPSKQVTIACTSGALGKCVRWGYKPWKSLDGQSLASSHQACVRMTRADYCGDGRAHTVDGTWIDVSDRFGIQRPTPEPGMSTEFEAGWSPDGATYIHVPRWTPHVAEIVAECPDKLAGRVSIAGVSLSRDTILARFPETLLFNDHASRAEDKKRRPTTISRANR